METHLLAERLLPALAGERAQAFKTRPWLQCEDASAMLVEDFARLGVPSRVVEFTRPDTTTHCVVLCDSGVVVDLTFGQYDPSAPWPLVEPLADYSRRHASGPCDVDLVARWDEAGLDVEDLAPLWESLGLVVPFGAASPEWFDRLVADHPVLYHVTTPRAAEAVLCTGLLPPGVGTSGVEMNSHPGAAPRPGCVYLGSAELYHDGWLAEWGGFADREHTTLAVDTASLALARLLPDEDTFVLAACVDPADVGLPAPLPGEGGGEWAHRVRLGAQPGVVERSFAERPTLAHLGPVPAEAITTV